MAVYLIFIHLSLYFYLIENVNYIILELDPLIINKLILNYYKLRNPLYKLKKKKMLFYNYFNFITVKKIII